MTRGRRMGAPGRSALQPRLVRLGMAAVLSAAGVTAAAAGPAAADEPGRTAPSITVTSVTPEQPENQLSQSSRSRIGSTFTARQAARAVALGGDDAQSRHWSCPPLCPSPNPPHLPHPGDLDAVDRHLARRVHVQALPLRRAGRERDIWSTRSARVPAPGRSTRSAPPDSRAASPTASDCSPGPRAAAARQRARLPARRPGDPVGRATRAWCGRTPPPPTSSSPARPATKRRTGSTSGAAPRAVGRRRHRGPGRARHRAAGSATACTGCNLGPPTPSESPAPCLPGVPADDRGVRPHRDLAHRRVDRVQRRLHHRAPLGPARERPLPVRRVVRHPHDVGGVHRRAASRGEPHEPAYGDAVGRLLLQRPTHVGGRRLHPGRHRREQHHADPADLPQALLESTS